MNDEVQSDEVESNRVKYEICAGDLTAVCVPWGASLASLDLGGQQLLRRIPLEAYPTNKGHFGSIAGPIANRVRDARASIHGVSYTLEESDISAHALHGGARGLGRRAWRMVEHIERAVTFEITLEDGELGLPGRRVYRCHYEVTAHNIDQEGYAELTLTLEMESDRDTLCNLAFHPYLCLDDSGSIFDHELTVHADAYLPTDHESLPTGEVRSVESAHADFRFNLRSPRALSALESNRALSLDHNFCFRGDEPHTLKPLATLYSSRSRVKLELSSTQVGLQIYTPESLGSELIKGEPLGRYPAICLEPQGWPDSPNHVDFPSILVEGGARYAHTSIFKLTR